MAAKTKKGEISFPTNKIPSALNLHNQQICQIRSGVHLSFSIVWLEIKSMEEICPLVVLN